MIRRKLIRFLWRELHWFRIQNEFPVLL
jgi:hypothetical protein